VLFTDYTDWIRARLDRPLPGLEAQWVMAPRTRVNTRYRTVPDDARHGSVLILLLDTGNGPAVPLIVRSDDGTTHGGQIGLPGGGYEEGDSFPVGTAVRETEEEIGADTNAIEVLGQLTPLYIWVSNYHITPVVGYYRGDHSAFVANPVEVERILICSVDELAAGRTRRSVEARGLRMRVPAYVAGDVEVWGATAMVLSEFFVVHREAEAAVSGEGADDG
jgi:8-oxo-dGTP pyrophosphatase MutT (NUDIX family)